MPDTPRVKASGLPVATALNDADLAIGVQAGITKTFPGELFLRLAQRGVAGGVPALDSNGVVAQAVRLMRAGADPAAPALAFDGDLDTGLYRPAANEVGIATGGAERMRVLAAETRFGHDVRIEASDLTEFEIARTDAADMEGRIGIGAAPNAPLLFRRTELGSGSEVGRFGIVDDDVYFRRAGSGVDRSIAERGSNSNGEYVRYYDGTQVCWHTLGSADRDSGSTEGMVRFRPVWTYPRAFSGSPNTWASLPLGTAGEFSGVDRADILSWGSHPSSTDGAGAEFVVWASSASAGATISSIAAFAIGRWY